MAIDGDLLRKRLRTAVKHLTGGEYEDQAATILYETANYERLRPTVINADDSLHTALGAAAASWLQTVVEDELVQFEQGFQPLENQVTALSVTDVPVLSGTLSLLEPPDTALQFDINDPTVSRLRGFSYSLRLDEFGWIHFFRRLTRSNMELQPRRGLYAVLVKNHYQLSPERGLRLDTNFDAVALGDDLLVRSHQRFERLFDFTQLTVPHAEATAKALVADLTIRGADEFIRVVSTDRRMHSKLQSASEKMSCPDYRAKVTNATIAALVNTRGDIDLEIVKRGSSIEIVFDGSAQRRWTLLKILDDDYLISELTKSRYQAPSKHTGNG